MTEQVWIGAAAGFAGDRSDASGPLIETLARHDGPRFLIFETLAERTLALAQLDRLADPARGEVPALQRLLWPALAPCAAAGIKIIGNFGGANPFGAAAKIRSWAIELGCPGLKIAVVTGDDLRDAFSSADFAGMETDGALLSAKPAIISANAYLGADAIAKALGAGADIVVTGRVADPALVLGPLKYSFGWADDDWDRLAAGILAGHLLECGSQVTGGYFADPGVKDVPGLDVLGYPIAEVEPDGSFVVTKPAGTGGLVDRRTVTEQMLYEIHDPAAYLTPDVILDLTQAEIAEIGPDRVRVSGARGRARPETLKATVCFDGGWLAEAEISYAGPNAKSRAALAIETVMKRLARLHPSLRVRADLIGVVSVFGDTNGMRLAAEVPDVTDSDLRVRFAAESTDRAAAECLLDEVEALYCAGPAGGGGVRRRLTPRLRSASCLVDRKHVVPQVSFLEMA
ncbi:acyclic terpene utilization AtuA family protein [Bosea sp. UC22_33]|uniref:acyclic terpene utilization AtuA family protein n=1 Tax=Bosea sp. UC22_33 TaxID=3350165 RepID=UPI0036707ABD